MKQRWIPQQANQHQLPRLPEEFLKNYGVKTDNKTEELLYT
jgi:hypothetical protein